MMNLQFSHLLQSHCINIKEEKWNHGIYAANMYHICDVCWDIKYPWYIAYLDYDMSSQFFMYFLFYLVSHAHACSLIQFDLSEPVLVVQLFLGITYYSSFFA